MANRAGHSTGNLDVFFRHMVGNMRNGVLAIDRDGGIVLLNDEARRLFHLGPGTVEGRRYADVLHEHSDIVRVLGGAFELKTLPNRAELRLKSTDTVIGYTLSLVRDDNGEPVGAALFFKDLTHVEQIEERERLRDRLAAVGEMAAVMAHEIKNPLAGIEVLAGLLRRKVPDNADALKSAITMADGKAKRGNIGVDVRIEDALPAIHGDRHQLTQVFANLLINAYEAMNGNGAITLGARVLDPQDEGALLPDGHHPVPTMLVEVADNGPGVPADLADKIFNPFFTTKAQGSGLGLAIVRKIVDAHEGRIDMTTSPQGTSFRVSLPVEHTGAWVR